MSHRKVYKVDNRPLVLASAVLFLICFVVFYQLKGDFLHSSSNNATPTPSPSSIDTVNDGIYTNYKYGFMFKYPKEKFKQETSLEDWATWVYEAKGSYIRIGVNVSTGKRYEDEKISFERNKIHPPKDYKILSESETEGYRTAVTYSLGDLNTPIDGNSSYTAYWWSKYQSKVVTLDFYSRNQLDSFIRTNKPLFDQIVQSFKFF